VADAHQLRTLSHEQRESLAELVDRWWPADGFAHAGSAAMRDERRRQLVAVRIGAELELPVAAARWAELFDAHFATDPWEQFDLGGNDVAWWLAKKRPPDADARLLEAIATAEDARMLSRLIGIASVGPRSDALTDALFSRLSALGPGHGAWLNAVGMLIEGGELGRARELLLADMTHEIRRAVVDRLAAAGDPAAQREQLGRLAANVASGGHPEAPRWRPPYGTSAPLDAVVGLARAALEHDAEVRTFALGLIEERIDDAAQAALAELAAVYAKRYPSLKLKLERHARRMATHAVLYRLPAELADAAAWFDALCAGGAGPSLAGVTRGRPTAA